MIHVQIAEFLRDTDPDVWDELWWSCIAPYIPYKDVGSACEIYVSMSNFLDEIACTTENQPYNIIQEKIQEILNRPQMAQRTDQWYAEGLAYLTGSQFATIFAGPRTRGQLVVEKAGICPAEKRANRLCTSSEYMNAFDWGIRFEPVVRAIYMDMTKTTVVDMGRLYHKTDNRLAASPDGLIIEETEIVGPCSRLGRLVEYKAPVTRKITDKIPKEYYMQMQLQMEVGDVDACDYCEMKFYSPYGAKMREPHTNPNPHYRGLIALIMKDGCFDRYIYSELNPDEEWTARTEKTLDETERIYEIIPWILEIYYMETVARDRRWFASVMPAIDAFWSDVAAAKAGTWTLPESTRALKKPKLSSMKIMDEEDE